MRRKHVIISVNPKAGARSGEVRVRRLTKLLTQRGYVVEPTTDIGFVAERSQQLLADEELHAVVGAGGDGTMSLIANRAPMGAAITPMPLGTENLFAKYLGIPSNTNAVCEVIDKGVEVRLDAGRVGESLFLLMFSCGLDADVVQRLHDGRDGHIHHFSYAKPILQALRNYKYPEVRIRCDEDDDTVEARWAFVFNLPCYAFGMGRRLAPQAVATDGQLDLVTFRRGSFSRGLSYFAAVLMGKHESMKDCTVRRARKIRVEADEPVPFELDGDPAGHLPAEIEVVPERLTLLVPREWATKNEVDQTADRTT